jgi:P-type Ca2+ transporter type 2C
MNWYQLDLSRIFTDLNTSEHGLTDTEVRERLQKFGPNRLAEEEKIGRLNILLHQFKSPLIYILLIAAVVVAVLEEYKETGVIAAVLLLNALIGYIQEFKAEKHVRALKKMVVSKARVLRDGEEQEVNIGELVPGDIVFLASGSRVPADLRLIKTIELRADESMLTGESMPAAMNPRATSWKRDGISNLWPIPACSCCSGSGSCATNPISTRSVNNTRWTETRRKGLKILASA